MQLDTDDAAPDALDARLHRWLLDGAARPVAEPGAGEPGDTGPRAADLYTAGPAATDQGLNGPDAPDLGAAGDPPAPGRAEDATLDARVHRRLLAAGGQGPVDDDTVTDLVRREAPLLGAGEVSAVVSRVRARIGGLGPLEPLLADPCVSDVLVNGPGPVWIERSGRLERTELALDRAAIDLLIERVTAPLALRADRTSPIVDARLPDGSRVHVVLPPLAVDGPAVTIRRFGAAAAPLADFCTPAVADLLVAAVDAGANMVVCGGTGAGKTTLLNALCGHLADGERVVTVEDTAELRLPGEHVVRLETRPATPDGLAAVDVRELVRAALRMRPDRIVVGEVRGAEALDMLQAMNTGHDGCLSTVHANGTADALRRIETMALMGSIDLPLAALREQVLGAIDVLVRVVRGESGARLVAEVAEVVSGPAQALAARPVALGPRPVARPTRPARRPGASAWNTDVATREET
ncbi:MAG TPA: CpaF family protein [Acidimicrobiales bacterium]|jgi:pilus assembly protein CpaF|nr:CpaF family protein [Acidimicrobiales bacterium]